MRHHVTPKGNECGIIDTSRGEGDFDKENLRAGRFFAYAYQGHMAQTRTLVGAERALDRAAKRGFTELHVYHVAG
jgi:hypothetical protein